MTRAAIYTRISTDPDGRQTATARQLDDCRRHIAAHGWTEVGVYEDPDISAFQRKPRPSFERLKADIIAGHVDVVLAWKLDRLIRQTRDFSAIDDICVDAGARIITIMDGIDTGVIAGRTFAGILTELARSESANTSIRGKRKHLELAKNGLPSGGRRQFGFTSAGKDIAIHPEEAALLREAATRILSGEGLSAVSRDWNERGYLTTRARLWRPGVLREALTSYNIIGQRHHMGVLYPAQWEAIISPAEHAALLRLFAPRTRGPKAPRTHFLTGLLACGTCGHPMRGKPVTSGARGYRCTPLVGALNCGNISRRADPLEEFIAELIFLRIEGDGFVERMLRVAAPSVDTDALLAVIRADELALDELAHDRYVARVIGPSEHATASTALTARLEANRAALAAIAPPEHGVDIMDLRDNVRTRWAGESVEWKHRVTGWLIERITVGPSPRGRVPFHKESIEVTWRL